MKDSIQQQRGSMEIKLNGGANSSLTLQFPRVDFTEWEPDYKIEFHGIHTMNDSEEKIVLTKVELLIPHTGYVDILKSLNYYQKLQLITELDKI